MKLLVLTSGGDAPGMNMVLYLLYKEFGKDLYACRAGFKGLINNDILPISEFKPQKYAKCAGSCIKCSRCPEFKEEKWFKIALENAKKFDVVIVMGGNGSYKGCQDLHRNGVRTIFIPSTIDNDVTVSDYSIGFHTAVNACQKMIENIMPTMEAFDRCCVFETMGRNSEKIARCTANSQLCDYLIASKDDIDYPKIAEIVKNNHQLGHSSCIVMKEKLMKQSTFISSLQKLVPEVEIRGTVIGYVQRGSKPTIIELEYAKFFAKLIIKVLCTKDYSAAIVYKNGKFDILYQKDEEIISCNREKLEKKIKKQNID